MITYETMVQGERFYLLLGPFLISRKVRRELGMAISSDENYRWIVALDGERAVGFGAVELCGEAVQLRHAYVIPEARGQGIYGEMIRRREDLARAAGFTLAQTVAAPASVPALEKHGYAAIGSRGQYTIMEKTL